MLIWAPYGCGLNYWGPGISAYNLYKDYDGRGEVELYLAHGFIGQKQNKCFCDQFLVANAQFLGPFGIVWFLLRSFFWIRKRAAKFDVVHILGNHHASFLPAIWFEKMGIPTALKISNASSGFSNNSKISKLLGLPEFRRKNSNRISAYISISSAITKELVDLGVDGSRVYEIPNGVDTVRFSMPNAAQRLKYKRELGFTDLPLFVCVGEITARKYQKLLVEVLALKLTDPFNILLVGPRGKIADHSTEILELVKSHNLESFFKWIPFTTEIETCYQAADAFVLASDNEGLSNAMLEAMSCGLPAIVTKISGSEDVVEAGVNGFFIDRDYVSLAGKIQLYTGNKVLLEQQGLEARRTIQDAFSREVVLARHLELFKSIVHQNKVIE